MFYSIVKHNEKQYRRCTKALLVIKKMLVHAFQLLHLYYLYWLYIYLSPLSNNLIYLKLMYFF